MPKRFFLAILIIASLFAFLQTVWWKQLETGNEGVDGIMALNMVQSFDKIIRPSYAPGGYENWVDEDSSLIGNTPFHSALLAGGYLLFGFRGMALMSYLALLTTVWYTFRLMSLWDNLAAWCAAILMMLSPAFLHYFQLMTFEPVLTAFGMSGLYYFVRGLRTQEAASSAIGGALFGLGFLTKLWLITPYIFASAGFVVALWLSNPKGTIRFLLITSLAFLVMASLHLLLVAVFSPTDIPYWLNNVYFGAFLAKGISGTKWSGVAGHPDWVHPFWYYFATLYRDYFYLTPFFLFGLLRFPRKLSEGLYIPFTMICAGLFSLILLSAPAIKEPLYILPVVPFVFMLAAFCLSALIESKGWYSQREKVLFLLVCTMIVLLTIPAGLYFYFHATTGGNQQLLDVLLFLSIHILVIGVLVAGIYLHLQGKKIGSLVKVSLSFMWLAYAIISVRMLDYRPPYIEMADLIRPRIQNRNSSAPVFVSPNVHVLEFYLFQKGNYWGTSDLDEPEKFVQNYEAYILDPKDQNDPRYSSVVKWLEHNHQDISQQLDERTKKKTGYRLFIR